MSVTTATRTTRRPAIARSSRDGDRPAIAPSRARAICAVSLMLGAGVHLSVGMTHSGSNFGALSLAAAAAQFSLGLCIYLGYLGRANLVANAVVVLSLVLVQLYVLNVTIGLPPAIAHVHSGGEHVVWGYTFALPNVIDAEGIGAVVTELIGAVSAAALLRVRALGKS